MQPVPNRDSEMMDYPMRYMYYLAITDKIVVMCTHKVAWSVRFIGLLRWAETHSCRHNWPPAKKDKGSYTRKCKPFRGRSLHFTTQEHEHINKPVSDLLNCCSTIYESYDTAFYNWHDIILWSHQPWWQHSIWLWFSWIITVYSLGMVHTSNSTLLRYLFICLAVNEVYCHTCHILISYLTSFCFCWVSAWASFILTEYILPVLVSSNVPVGALDSPSRPAIFRANMQSPTFTYYRCSIVHLMHLCDEHVDNVWPHTYTQKEHRYRRFPRSTNHVEFAQARPNHAWVYLQQQEVH